MPTITGSADRTRTPQVGDERETLLSMLAFQRDTIRWKCSGLSSEQLAQRHAPSALTLGGLLKHLAVVEAGWVNLTFAGGVEAPSWLDQWQRENEGWTFTTAAADSPAQLFAWLDESQRVTEQIVASAAGLDVLAVNPPEGEGPYSLRWILLHLVQEYARHLGHADLIREAIDGSVGV
ncbi:MULTISPECIES: DinB family protein [unclassified Isoptericola]|uniref:DinB family protein n=1 Tax=unclassified Isoptericola TaxID=2623355 RepID=UPI00271320B6|nr:MULTISPECIES: DinB family protein [unclassified Isoptericola]MDO8144824.1 DinB family protein [Isoptericola sp. 178]MDO8149604.1 DinB family protein [Isoptericola sp. b515]MDO8152538.1 DinB family protein [Isoptericola sp. b408]